MWKWLRRLLMLALPLSGWAVAALCLHVVRVPDPADASRSKWVVVPKNHLAAADTYVDARHWTAADLPAHADVVRRAIDTGHAAALGFLVDARAPVSLEEQLRAASDPSVTPKHRPTTRQTR